MWLTLVYINIILLRVTSAVGTLEYMEYGGGQNIHISKGMGNVVCNRDS